MNAQKPSSSDLMSKQDQVGAVSLNSNENNGAALPRPCTATQTTSQGNTDERRRRYWILGLPFDAVTLIEAVNCIRDAAHDRVRLFISTPNVNFLIATQKDVAFRDSVVNSNLSLADGMPIVWLAKLLKIPIYERVAGSDLFDALRYQPLESGQRPVRIFFFGGARGIAERAHHAVNRDSSSMHCVGHYYPGFGSLDDMSAPAVLAYINASQADFVVVSLGAQKGQAWIERNRSQLQTPIICHLGAVVNFVAGNVQRAPTWMQRAGLEWVWRIKEEPELLKRYANDAWGLARLCYLHILPAMLGRR